MLAREGEIAVNPACAGMILTALTIAPMILGKPRVCGDDPDGRQITEMLCR